MTQGDREKADKKGPEVQTTGTNVPKDRGLLKRAHEKGNAMNRRQARIVKEGRIGNEKEGNKLCCTVLTIGVLKYLELL